MEYYQSGKKKKGKEDWWDSIIEASTDEDRNIFVQGHNINIKQQRVDNE